MTIASMGRANEPTKVGSWLEERKVMAGHIRQHARDGETLEILEAGCGTTWGLDIAEVDYRLTGVDLDPVALEHRLKIHKDLDDAVCGDLRTLTLPENRYDVIFNSYVLEHVPGAEAVLRNFAKWLKPGGILILVIPNRDSVQGFVTRITPMWFHVMFSKYVQGNKFAGKPGYAPYPTFYDKVVSRRGVHEFCSLHGLSIDEEYSVGHGQRNQKWLVYVVTRALVWTMHWLSLGSLGADNANMIFVIRKVPAARAPA